MRAVASVTAARRRHPEGFLARDRRPHGVTRARASAIASTCVARRAADPILNTPSRGSVSSHHSRTGPPRGRRDGVVCTRRVLTRRRPPRGRVADARADVDRIDRPTRALRDRGAGSSLERTRARATPIDRARGIGRGRRSRTWSTKTFRTFARRASVESHLSRVDAREGSRWAYVRRREDA